MEFSRDLGQYDLIDNLAKTENASVSVLAKTRIQEDSEVEFEILEVCYSHD